MSSARRLSAIERTTALIDATTLNIRVLTLLQAAKLHQLRKLSEAAHAHKSHGFMTIS